MKKRSASQWWCGLALFLSAVAFSGTVQGTAALPQAEAEIDAVWSTTDGRRIEVFYTQLRDGAWGEPVQVTDDYFDNHYPVIDRDSTGRRWVFWSAYASGKMELHYTSGSGESWQRAMVLTDTFGTNNTAPSVVIDKLDRIWVVWAAHSGQSDDILFAVHENGVWSEPERLHEENMVPDVLPVVSLDGDGTPRVSWLVLAGDTYQSVSTKWLGEGWSEPEREPDGLSGGDVAEEQKLELPSFVGQSSMVFIRVY